MYKKQKGFTLVEMILVTVIIGIVAGIVINVINIPRVQAKSRDSKRVGDLKRIQTALELYFADNRKYPVEVVFVSPEMIDENNDAVLDLQPFINPVPKDMFHGKTIPDSSKRCFSKSVYGYQYKTNASGGKYVLGVPLEISGIFVENLCSDISNCDPAIINCGNLNNHCYCVQNPM